jgi:cupin superfamily acireductone dioxygenase involved in methionine salvage
MVERNVRQVILKRALDLRRSIDEYRRNINDLATNKGISNPEVIRLNQELDKKIIILQKMLVEIHSEPSTLFQK